MWVLNLKALNQSNKHTLISYFDTGTKHKIKNIRELNSR